MDGKHLTKGSACPPFPEGKLRLYNMRFCPFAHRANLVLEAKKIPYEIVNIHLREKPEWYFEKNPLGKVPAIELASGESIYESLIIADYLDELYPKNPLHNKNPAKKALDRLFIESFSKVGGLLFKFYQEPSQENLENIMTELDYVERELKKRGKPFFGGDKPGMVDYMIWPWIERMESFKIVSGGKVEIPANKYQKMEEWKKLMKEDEAVKAVYITPENHAKFVKSFMSGSSNYDIVART